MRSLLAPLVIGLVMSLVGVVSVQWSIVRTSVDEMVIEYIAGGLRQDADELFGSLTVLPDGHASLALNHYDPPFLRPHSGRYFQILVGRATALRSPSLAGEVLAVTAVAPGQHRVAQIKGPRQQTLLLSLSGYEFQGRWVTVGVADDLGPIRAQFQRLMTRYTEVSLLMFGLLVVLQVAIVRFALAPLRRLRSEVRRLDRGEIRQLSERAPTELLPLVREINRLLVLLAQRLQRSRESLGNLAHALKAPLTVLMHMVEKERLEGDSVLARQMHGQLEILRGRIDAELRRARVAGGRAPGAALDIGNELDALVAALAQLYRERALDIAARVAGDAQFSGDREDFLELCGNLLDNACKWARSRVRISVSGADGLCLTVEDDGPGCSPQDLARIAARGVRLDESTEGHGLGLSIATSIAASFGAQLEFGRSADLGGFEVRVRFPPEAAPAR